MEDNQMYSMECQNKQLKIKRLKGTEKADVNATIKNNSKEKYPKNWYLVWHNKNSLLLCENVKINELEPFQ